MCGIAGYTGISNPETRVKLVMSLGEGIDRRGGHASGFVGLDSADSGRHARVHKVIGKWKDASSKFIRNAAMGEVSMMHARYATCGERDNPNHAHPFTIRRGEGAKPVLYGVHNGMISGAADSAEKNGRKFTVDSRELYELLADDRVDDIQKLSGYGVLTWVVPASGAVYVVRLSSNSDFVATTLKGGGMVWASTGTILDDALKYSGLVRGDTVFASIIGTVYMMTPDGFLETTEKRLKFNESHYERKCRIAREAWSNRGDWDDFTPPSSERTFTGSYSGYGNYGGYLSRDRDRKEESYSEWWGSERAKNKARLAASDASPPLVTTSKGYSSAAVGSTMTSSNGTVWEKYADGWRRQKAVAAADTAKAKALKAWSLSPPMGEGDEPAASEAPTLPNIRVAVQTFTERTTCVHNVSLDAECNQGSCRSSFTEYVRDVTRRPELETVDLDAPTGPTSGKVVVSVGGAGAMSLDSMTATDLDEVSEDEWDDILKRYMVGE